MEEPCVRTNYYVHTVNVILTLRSMNLGLISPLPPLRLITTMRKLPSLRLLLPPPPPPLIPTTQAPQSVLNGEIQYGL